MTTDTAGLVRIEKPRAGAAAETLGKAFYDYLLLRYFFPEEKKREKIAGYFTAYTVYAGIGSGEVYASSERFEGVAVWTPSDNYPLTPWRMLRSVPLRVIFGLAASGFARMKDLGAFLDEEHRELAPFRHMYLQAIGVDPAYQGQGFAGSLLRPVLSRLDAEGLPCYLETLEEKNASLYEHFCFTLVRKSDIPGTELINWAMLRKPAK